MFPDLVLVLFADYNPEIHGEIQGVLTTKKDFLSRDSKEAALPTYVLINAEPEHLMNPKTVKIKGEVAFYE
jgi:hypothetical protein